MGRVITDLQVQQRNKERVSLFLDGEYAFSVPLLAAAGLAKGQELDEAEEAQLRKEANDEFAYQQAVRYLGLRPRSISEMNRYLRGKQYTEETIESTLQRLQEQGYLNDEEFAQFWVDNRARFRPRSGRALRYELRQRGVATEIADEAIEGQDDEAAAWAAIEPKLLRWGTLERADFENKASGFLARRGFDFGTCRRVVARAWAELQGDENSMDSAE